MLRSGASDSLSVGLVAGLVLGRYIHYWAGHKYGGSRGLRTEEGISQLLLSVMTIRAPILTSPAPTAPAGQSPATAASGVWIIAIQLGIGKI